MPRRCAVDIPCNGKRRQRPDRQLLQLGAIHSNSVLLRSLDTSIRLNATGRSAYGRRLPAPSLPSNARVSADLQGSKAEARGALAGIVWVDPVFRSFPGCRLDCHHRVADDWRTAVAAVDSTEVGSRRAAAAVEAA